MVKQLQPDPRCAQVLALGRGSTPPIDFAEEASIAAAAQYLRSQPDFAPLHLLVVATGMLHSGSAGPEKRLAQLNYAHLMASFTTNTFGPALA